MLLLFLFMLLLFLLMLLLFLFMLFLFMLLLFLFFINYPLHIKHPSASFDGSILHTL
jgi:hypothetical protein